MNIIILGPPGAGKGTQAELLASKLKISRLSVGALVRRIWRERGKKSEEIGRYMLKGLTVPAKLFFEALEPWFDEHKNGFVVDNLPRSLDQLEEFKTFIKKKGIKIDKVFHLTISEKESAKRIIKRFRERSKTANVRPDDNPKIIETRFKEGYQKEIAPILAFFDKKGVLVEINGEQPIEKVHQDILKNLND